MKTLLRALLVAAGLSSVFATQAANFREVATPAAHERIPGKVLVQQFLSFQCPHCQRLDSSLNPWLKTTAEDVKFERMPVVWQPAQATQASLYGLAKVMNNNQEISDEQLNAISDGMFALHFVEQKPLDAANVYSLFQPTGLSEAAYTQRLLSMPVMLQQNRSVEQTRNYRISSVPSFVVDGTYEVSFDTLEGDRTAENLLKALDETIEYARKHP